MLDNISEYLYEHETITGKEFMKIFRELKGIPEPEGGEKKTFFEQAMEVQEAENHKTESNVGQNVDYTADDNTTLHSES